MVSFFPLMESLKSFCGWFAASVAYSAARWRPQRETSVVKMPEQKHS